MPPIYFYRNYKYREHNSSIGESRFLPTKDFFSYIVNTIEYVFSPVMIINWLISMTYPPDKGYFMPTA